MSFAALLDRVDAGRRPTQPNATAIAGGQADAVRGRRASAPQRGAAVRPHRAIRLTLIASLGVVAVASAAAGALYGSLPGVGDARARVAHSLEHHGGRIVRVNPDARVARAIVAVEDERFFQHGALDPVAIARVLGSSVTGGGVDPGGSTIAQQLAKVIYREPETLLGRLRAIGLAFKLEQRYRKREILSMYLNAVYFGHGYYGVEQASQGYFRRNARNLSWPQAALLAGLPQAPSAFDPYLHLGAARRRQRQVLAQLVDRGELTRRGARRVFGERLGLTH
jgi:penicillin-binding protein 1A